MNSVHVQRKKIAFVFILSGLIGVAFIHYSQSTSAFDAKESRLSSNNGIPTTLPQQGNITEIKKCACSSTDDEGVYIIPGNDVLDGYDERDLTRVYWKYINTLQVLCRNQTRLGYPTDGGKEVCIDNHYKPKPPCLVYSFGSNGAYDFEQGVKEVFKCEIHTFDPTMPRGRDESPKFVNFHPVGLGAMNITYNGRFHIRRLETIMKQLRHEQRTIDLLKIDIEGWEWLALPDMVKSGVLSRVRQLCIETHFGAVQPETRNSMRATIRKLLFSPDSDAFDLSNGESPRRSRSHQGLDNSAVKIYGDTKHMQLNANSPLLDMFETQVDDLLVAGNWGGMSMATQLKALRGLYEQGFRIFMRDRNLGRVTPFEPPYRYITRINEISLINVHYITGSG